jgi:hypothetical protein
LGLYYNSGFFVIMQGSYFRIIGLYSFGVLCPILCWPCGCSVPALLVWGDKGGNNANNVGCGS